MGKQVTVYDIAHALGVSTGTVHRALHDHAGISPVTKTKVLQTAKQLGYRPNLAARYLSQRQKLRVSVNTLRGTTSFWDEVRAGVKEEANSLGMQRTDIEYRTYELLSEGGEEAFAEAMDADVDGIILFPSHPGVLRPWIRRASRLRIPVVCVSTDAPESGRLAVVATEARVSGALAADLIGRLSRGAGEVAVTFGDAAISEHTEKCSTFESTLRSFYPGMKMVGEIEDHNFPSEAYEKALDLFHEHPDLIGIYVMTEMSLPVIRAARETKMLDRLIIVTTDLFPALVEHIRSGAVLATIYQRPYSQGRMAFRVLHDFLVEGKCPSDRVTLAPHLVMRGNLDFFLQRQSFETVTEQGAPSRATASDVEEHAIGQEFSP
jgi:LacI family transcriptional regulator